MKNMIVLSCLFLFLGSIAQAGQKVEMITSLGTIEIELNSEKAPVSVKNFLEYIDQEYYDGTIFHRVIKGFMIQGGGFDQNEQRKITMKPIKNEADNGLKNNKGTIAMARTSVIDSATSQFLLIWSITISLITVENNERIWLRCFWAGDQRNGCGRKNRQHAYCRQECQLQQPS